MKKTVLLIILLLASNLYGAKSGPLKVAVTTSHLGVICKEIGRDKVEVVTAVDGALCPGNFDADPRLAAKMAGAKLVIYHAWEPWLNNLTKLLESENVQKETVKIEGSLMVPEKNIEAIDEVLSILIRVDPDNSKLYVKNAQRYKENIKVISENIRKKGKMFSGKNVICADRQADFARWLGFNVLETYGADGATNPKLLAKLLKEIRSGSSVLLVENMQNSSSVSEIISKEVPVRRVILTNFPLHDSYIKSLEENISKIEKEIE